MGYSDKPLDNPINWSFKVGRLFGIDIRVHIAFVICAFVLIAMEMPKGEDASTVPLATSLLHALGGYAILFIIVLLHEFGHCFGARYTGGEAHEILIWPLGGLAYTQPPHTPRAHMITTVAGPMVNVVICGICSAVIVMWTGRLGAVPWNPLHPMWPATASIIPTESQLWLMRVFGISYLLLLFNLLPIFPFDGGRVLQAFLWPRKGYARSMEIATSTGMIGAVIVGVFALFIEASWLLMMIAVFGYLTCWQTRRVLREQGTYGLSEAGMGYGSGGEFDVDEVDREPGFFEKRRLKREAAKAERERQQREQRDQVIEQILRKVSDHGMHSLTPQERATLEKETKRQQSLSSGDTQR